MSEARPQAVPYITVFCAEEDGRYRISKPWVKSGWRYATDGRVVVRVPAPGEPDESGDRLLDGGHWFGEFNFHAARCTEPFPAHDGRTIEQACDNEAHMKECPDCNGSGTCRCPRCEHPHDCPECKGNGYRTRMKTRCPDCNAFGYRDEPAPQVVAGKRIGGAVAIRIAGLSGALYYSDGHAGRPLHFVADGGIQGVSSIICNTEERETGKLNEPEN